MNDLFLQPVATNKSNGIPCSRCGRICVIKGVRNEDAKLLRAATKKTKNGVCATCGFRLFIAETEPLCNLIGHGCPANPDDLKLPHIQELVRDVMRTGGADASFEEIDFDHLIKTWDAK